jgi:cob(I)alamin adenosyltransferase
MSGRILLFTGDGKGKTTAAIGMALRAWGQGIKVLVIQFVKNFQDTGEFKAIKKLEGFDIVQAGLGFIPKDKKSQEFEQHARKSRDTLKFVSEIFKKGDYGFVILDEVCFAVSSGLLQESDVLETIGFIGENHILVMTGRGAGSGLIDAADTVTEMKNIKHGYDQGINAQPGVEY